MLRDIKRRNRKPERKPSWPIGQDGREPPKPATQEIRPDISAALESLRARNAGNEKAIQAVGSAGNKRRRKGGGIVVTKGGRRVR